MLKAYSLPFEYKGELWKVSPLTGSLLRYKKAKNQVASQLLPDIVIEALKHCDNPYGCAWNPVPKTLVNFTTADRQRLLRYNNVLHKLGSAKFLLSILYGGIKAPLFESSDEAFSEVALLATQLQNRATSCLQRSLLVAKTSKSFAREGVLLVGASFECVDMHAWIIEAGKQPDHEDRSWINYRPLLAMVMR